MAKTVLAFALLAAGYVQRCKSLPAILKDPPEDDPSKKLYLLGLLELVTMAACYAAGVALSERMFLS